jgi:hypothetical protein
MIQDTLVPEAASALALAACDGGGFGRGQALVVILSRPAGSEERGTPATVVRMKTLELASLPTLLFLGAACSESTPPRDAEVLDAPSRDGWVSDAAFPGFTLIGSLKSRRAHLVDMSGTSVHSWLASDTPSAMCLTERGTLMRCLDLDDDHPIFRGGGASGRIEELDWDGTVLWDFRWDSEEGASHHDFAELPNGNILFIAWDRHTREEALAAGRDPELLEGDELWPDAVYEIRPTRPAGGEVVWSWHAWDHLVQDFDPSAPNYGEPASRPERIDVNGDRNPDPPTEAEDAAEAARMAAMGYGGGSDDDAADDAQVDAGDAAQADAGDAAPDEAAAEEEDPEEAALKARIKDADWMHTNGIDYNPALDQIALSVRRYDEIWIIDHSTTTEEAASSRGGRSGKGGDLLYRWGNPFAYGMGRWEDRQLLGQHNVQWIPAGYLGAGNLLAFDNGTDKDRGWSTVDEWWAPRDADGNYVREEGQPFGPAEPDWSYAAAEPTDFFSSFISGVQRLPNGNTLVCSGAQGWVFEVTPAGAVVWDWKNPHGIDAEVDEPEEGDRFNPRALFRAERYAPDHPGIVALRAKGAPIPLDPGAGPATNQYVEPAEEAGEESED